MFPPDDPFVPAFPLMRVRLLIQVPATDAEKTACIWPDVALPFKGQEMTIPDMELQNWFDLLEKMQKIARNINNDTKDDLGDFSGQEVAKVLANDLAKATFQAKMNDTLIIADSDIKNSKTFVDLLSTAHGHLDSFVLGVFQSVIDDASSPKEFKAKLTKGLYTADQRLTLSASLTTDMRPQWFPGRTGTKAAALLVQLASDGNKVSDSVAFVAKLEPAPQPKEEK
jgi:hypothetical protein